MQFAKRSILYIDDDEGTRLMLTLHFGQQGFEVTAVGSSHAAMYLTPEESFDLYILGPRLSSKGSAAFCQEIREFERHAPIIIYSGDADGSEKDAALCVGRTVFIANLGMDKLLDKVKSELEF